MPEHSPSYWFVGASYSDDGDQTARFFREGIWENGYTDKYLEQVRSIQPGDRIAIKAAHTQKHGLPFDGRGNTASVMSIKAIGTVTDNAGDGRRIKVDWTPLPKMRRWYFYTLRLTIHKVVPDYWMSQALIAFTFEDGEQDLTRFRNDPFWKDRFGDRDQIDERFRWAAFYSAIARSLLVFKENRVPLVQKINELAARCNLSHLRDEVERGVRIPMEDVCPFTVMGIFNRGNTAENRKMLAKEIADILGVVEPVPERFDGIPVLDNRKSCFYSFARERLQGDIPALWDVLQAAMELVDASGDEACRTRFIQAYDKAREVRGVSWNLTMGLYWAFPWDFLTLDGVSRSFLQKVVGIKTDPAYHPSHLGDAYLALLDRLEESFLAERAVAHSFPELSLKAWESVRETEEVDPDELSGREPPHAEYQDLFESWEASKNQTEVETYDLAGILSDGCFLTREVLERMLSTWREKKNLILQGAPGTGKTWLAKRLGFALMGAKDRSRLRSFQFHPNLSYEDFVRGYRPSAGGSLEVQDGPFLDMVRLALSRPDEPVVLVVEEINRGNPAQIFGELLTLLESSKRHPDEALELSYKDPGGHSRSIHLPPNLYLIGTMNIADRSLALVDLALRRRFAFETLEPNLNEAWESWLVNRCGFEPAIVKVIRERIESVNRQICSSPGLGKSFQIGHSFVTPSTSHGIPDGTVWFHNVVKTEIVPLLGEYWFDNPGHVAAAEKELLTP